MSDPTIGETLEVEVEGAALPPQFARGIEYLGSIDDVRASRFLSLLSKETLYESRNAVVEALAALDTQADTGLLSDLIITSVAFRSAWVGVSAERIGKRSHNVVARSFPHLSAEEREKFAERFAQAVASEVVRLHAKALQLQTEQLALYRASSAITELRPVFSEDLDRIHGYVVAHVLRVRHVGGLGEDEQTLELNLDHEDLQRLAETIERALSKQASIQAALASSGSMVYLPMKAEQEDTA